MYCEPTHALAGGIHISGSQLSQDTCRLLPQAGGRPRLRCALVGYIVESCLLGNMEAADMEEKIYDGDKQQ